MRLRAGTQEGYESVSVCGRWHDYEAFLADMGEVPSSTHSIDRIDGTKGYEPGNCRWATYTEQNRNRPSVNRRLEWRGESLVLTEWAERIGMHAETLRGRIRKGWPVERALGTPVDRRFSRSAR